MAREAVDAGAELEPALPVGQADGAAASRRLGGRRGLDAGDRMSSAPIGAHRDLFARPPSRRGALVAGAAAIVCRPWRSTGRSSADGRRSPGRRAGPRSIAGAGSSRRGPRPSVAPRACAGRPQPARRSPASRRGRPRRRPARRPTWPPQPRARRPAGHRSRRSGRPTAHSSEVLPPRRSPSLPGRRARASAALAARRATRASWRRHALASRERIASDASPGPTSASSSGCARTGAAAAYDRRPAGAIAPDDRHASATAARRGRCDRRARRAPVARRRPRVVGAALSRPVARRPAAPVRSPAPRVTQLAHRVGQAALPGSRRPATASARLLARPHEELARSHPPPRGPAGPSPSRTSRAPSRPGPRAGAGSPARSPPRGPPIAPDTSRGCRPSPCGPAP